MYETKKIVLEIINNNCAIDAWFFITKIEWSFLIIIKKNFISHLKMFKLLKKYQVNFWISYLDKIILKIIKINITLPYESLFNLLFCLYKVYYLVLIFWVWMSLSIIWSNKKDNCK